MDSPACSIDPNTTVSAALSLQFHHFDLSRANIAPCLADSDATYIRPSDGGSLLPWPYALAWLLVHLPVTVLRVSHWQRVQTLSIALAVFSVYFTLQAYMTHLEPHQVLVWTPLPIILDVGAMMQLAFLIIRENGVLLLWCAVKDSIRRVRTSRKAKEMRVVRRTSMFEAAAFSAADPNVVQTVTLPPELPRGHGLVAKAYLVLISLALLTALVVLQLIGLRYAATGRHVPDIKARYCSPLFQSSLAVLTSCEVLPVNLMGSHTIGCIDLPGTEQKRWLTATVAILSISLVLEAFDAAVLILLGTGTLWRGRELSRPWASMIGGNIALAALLVVSVYYSQMVPPGTDGDVWVFRYEASVQAATVCRSGLEPGGVRGQVIAWTDGFLNSWGRAYYGFTKGTAAEA